MADSLYAIRKLVYEEKKVTMEEMKEALAWNYGKGIDDTVCSRYYYNCNAEASGKWHRCK